MRNMCAVIGIFLGIFLTVNSPSFANSEGSEENYKATYPNTPMGYGEGLIVKLPRNISGEELARVIPEAVQKVPGLKMYDQTEYMYVPGHAKRVAAAWYRFNIYHPGSSWFSTGDNLRINFKHDEKYSHLIFAGSITSTNHHGFKLVIENFEKLVQNIYESLGHPQ